MTLFRIHTSKGIVTHLTSGTAEFVFAELERVKAGVRKWGVVLQVDVRSRS